MRFRALFARSMTTQRNARRNIVGTKANHDTESRVCACQRTNARKHCACDMAQQSRSTKCQDTTTLIIVQEDTIKMSKLPTKVVIEHQKTETKPCSQSWKHAQSLVHYKMPHSTRAQFSRHTHQIQTIIFSFVNNY